MQVSVVVGALVLLRGIRGSLRRYHAEELRKSVNRRDYVREEDEGAHGFDLSDTKLMQLYPSTLTERRIGQP